MNSSEKPTEKAGKKSIAENRKARFNFHIEETFEAGIVLTGPEMKSVRAGMVNLSDSYITHQQGELWLVNAHVSKYTFLDDREYQPTRRRKLLMHKIEIERLATRSEQKGFTIIPLEIYLIKGRAKLALGLAKGKDAPDKRRTIQERELNREAQRAMKKG